MHPNIASSSNTPASTTTRGVPNNPSPIAGRSVATAAVAVAAAGLASRAAGSSIPPPPFLVQIFLRGGADGLTFVVPYNDLEYQNRRTATKLNPPGSGGNQALPLTTTPVAFGLAPALAPLLTLFGENKLHFVHATGPLDDTRSHFVQQDLVERGETAALTAHQSGLLLGFGWLGRHLITKPKIQGSTGKLRALSLTTNPVATFRGEKSTFTTTPQGFSFPGTNTSATRENALRDIYSSFAGTMIGDNQLVRDAMANDLGAIDRLSRVSYARVPSLPPGVSYSGGIGSALKSVADIVHDPDTAGEIEVVNIDMGGWDTHFNQGVVGSGSMATLMSALANSLLAFQRDMEGQVRPFCVLVLTEFGRTTDENSSGGTDHGRGGVAILQASAGVLAGPSRVHAPGWAGLPTPALGDLGVATDQRHLMTEILQQFLGNFDPKAMHTFGPPHYVYARQNLFN